MNTPCHYEIYGKVRGGEREKVGGREREKVRWGERGKVRGGERVDGIRGLEQREVAEIRVERSGTQSVCEYGVFDTKTESVGYQNITFLAFAVCLHPHGKTEEALWGRKTGFSVTGEGSGICLKMRKRGCEKAETGRL